MERMNMNHDADASKPAERTDFCSEDHSPVPFCLPQLLLLQCSKAEQHPLKQIQIALASSLPIHNDFYHENLYSSTNNQHTMLHPCKARR